MPANHSALFVKIALSTEMNRWSCAFRHSTLCATSSFDRIGRAVDLPDGSPTRAVAPPTSTIGVWPHFCMMRIAMTGSRCPTWRLLPVGSNPT